MISLGVETFSRNLGAHLQSGMKFGRSLRGKGKCFDWRKKILFRLDIIESDTHLVQLFQFLRIITILSNDDEMCYYLTESH